jgi:hypothetical protein
LILGAFGCWDWRDGCFGVVFSVLTTAWGVEDGSRVWDVEPMRGASSMVIEVSTVRPSSASKL